MMTGVLQDQQYMFGVKCLLMVGKMLSMRNDLVDIVSTTDDRYKDRSSRFSHAVWPACDGINVYMNLDDTLKNETLMFKSEPSHRLI